MAFVEQIAYRWADNIAVERDGDSLLVKGQNMTTLDLNEDSPSADVLLAYWRYAQDSKPIPGQLRGGRLAPHVQFANAETDEDLIAFVRKYGPVNGSWKSPGPLAKDRTRIEVLESLQRLRLEQVFLSSAFRLKAALEAGSEGDIVNVLHRMIGACTQPASKGEHELRMEWLWGLFLFAKQEGLRGNASGLEAFIRSRAGERLREYGWFALCLIWNNFPPVIAPIKDGLVEMAQPKKAGILPALLFMLRRDCLLSYEIRICDQRDCGRWFKVERGGQRFCSDRCSQLQRQREYWERKGKKARALRVARKRNKKGEKKRVTV